MIIKVMVNSLENTVGDFVLLSLNFIGVCFSSLFFILLEEYV